jgi:hypothetical protein
MPYFQWLDLTRFALIYHEIAVVYRRREGNAPMSSKKTRKFTPEIDAKLYEEFVAVAEKNGQSRAPRPRAGSPVLPA